MTHNSITMQTAPACGFSLFTAVTETVNIKHNGNKVFAGFMSQLTHHEGNLTQEMGLLSNRYENLVGLQDWFNCYRKMKKQIISFAYTVEL